MQEQDNTRRWFDVNITSFIKLQTPAKRTPSEAAHLASKNQRDIADRWERDKYLSRQLSTWEK